jgi:hypothetical protein
VVDRSPFSSKFHPGGRDAAPFAHLARSTIHHVDFFYNAPRGDAAAAIARREHPSRFEFPVNAQGFPGRANLL